MNILSIDGGGIRGIIPAIVLAEIERRTGSKIAGLFDLIAGTSTGGILALGLTRPGNDGTPRYSASDLVTLYEGKTGSASLPQAVGYSPCQTVVADLTNLQTAICYDKTLRD